MLSLLSLPLCFFCVSFGSGEAEGFSEYPSATLTTILYGAYQGASVGDVVVLRTRGDSAAYILRVCSENGSSNTDLVSRGGHLH